MESVDAVMVWIKQKKIFLIYEKFARKYKTCLVLWQDIGVKFVNLRMNVGQIINVGEAQGM